MKVRFWMAAIILLFLVSPVQAAIYLIWFGAPEELYIRVGAVSGITTVTHDVPVANIGDGTPITGVPNQVFIEAWARRSSFWGALTTRFMVTADSSTPLRSGTHSIPFTDISWTSQDGSIPNGRFNGTSGQIILSDTLALFGVNDQLTFVYDNTRVVPAGNYAGSVTYTVSIP